MYKSIQFIGTQRSGSNLLRLILNEHELISAPHPPHLLKTFIPLLPKYRAAYGHRLVELIEDMCNWVESNPVPWTHVQLDREKIQSKATSIFDIFEQIYIQKAQADKAQIWCCKSTFNIHYVEDIELKIRPFYIHLYRDGRDVAASFKKVVVGPKHIYHLAKQWQEEQVLSLKLLERIEPTRKIQVSYESLLLEPEGTIKSICDKLGIAFTGQMLRYYKSEESQHTAESGTMWEHVVEPIIKNNRGKYHSELSEEEIMIFEKVAGDALSRLGYQCDFPTEANSINLDVGYFDVLNQKMMAEARQKASPSELQKRAGQESLLARIKNRFELIANS